MRKGIGTMKNHRKWAAALFGLAVAAALGSCCRDCVRAEKTGFPVRGEALMAEASAPEKPERQRRKAKKEIEPSILSMELPGWGEEFSDFVPAGWQVRDCVELDFNGDGLTDYVGVLEVPAEEGFYYDASGLCREYPRILFAIASVGENQYRLDFQDTSLIRTRNEGGVYGDPYLPLTAEGNSFTTHCFGGSAWKWAEDYTYAYREGKWYLTFSETTYGYGWYITSIETDDWEKGVGVRKERSSDFEEMEKNMEAMENGEMGEEDYDLVYEVKLDKAPTIHQAGMKWWLAPDRVTDWEVRDIWTAEGVELTADEAKLPGQQYYDYCDTDCVLYSFTREESGKSYIARYLWKEQSLQVLAEEDTAIDNLRIYKGKLYYSVDVEEDIVYKTRKDGTVRTERARDTVGLNLFRLNLDGTGKECVFTYRCPEAGEEVLEGPLPYLAFTYELTGDEIVLEVYCGDGPHPVYRMNTDGSGVELIGWIPKK